MNDDDHMDMVYLPIYIFAGIIVLIAVIVVIVHNQQKKRREDLKKAAGRFGFLYSQTPDPMLFPPSSLLASSTAGIPEK